MLVTPTGVKSKNTTTPGIQGEGSPKAKRANVKNVTFNRGLTSLGGNDFSFMSNDELMTKL